MLAPQVLQIPHFLEDQFVWLSIGTWGMLLMWLRTRISRRRVLMWAALAGALHLTPVAAQVLRATSAISFMADDMPFTFWALQVFNVLVLGTILGIWYVAQRRAARLRQVQAVMNERRRIANDLHDGVGSRLVALLASQDPKASGPDSLAMALQACLLELQLTVDGLDDQTHATVLERLGHLRYRLRPAFERMGITLEWNISAEAQTLDLPPETATQVCRVAQEALSNALRHSRASRVELRVAAQDRGRALSIEVRDNGRGLQPQATGSPELPAPTNLGKGLRSMHSRAEAIGGELDIMGIAPYGLCVRLVVPCKAAADEPQSTRPQAESML
jgi:signal transduction histidine kinase